MDRSILYGHEEPGVVQVIEVAPGLLHVAGVALVPLGYVLGGAGAATLVHVGMPAALPVFVCAFVAVFNGIALQSLNRRHWDAVEATAVAQEGEV